MKFIGSPTIGLVQVSLCTVHSNSNSAATNVQISVNSRSPYYQRFSLSLISKLVVNDRNVKDEV